MQAKAKPSQELIKVFFELSTANISDALDRLRVRGGCLGLASLVAGSKMVGPAFTVKYVPAAPEPGTVGDYIDMVEPGSVVVLDNGGRTWCTVWGDLLTITAKKRGVAGTVIDGVCRDVHRILELRYPVFSRGRFMVTGKDRVQMEAMDVPVSLGDVLVKPGDIVVGDDSGVVIVPADKAEQVLQEALKISQAETFIEKELEGGSSLTEARQKYGYHSLQRGR